MKSLIMSVGQHIPFPMNIGERIYQVPFYKNKPLPANIQRWRSTIEGMLQGIDCDGEMYLMVDQGLIRAGDTHRRPGVHIDGHWCKALNRHDDGHNVHIKDEMKGGIVLASDIAASKAYVGEFEGEINEGGDCSHIDVSKGIPVNLQPYTAYLGNVTCLHESVPVERDTRRTLVRITLPSDFEIDINKALAA